MACVGGQERMTSGHIEHQPAQGQAEGGAHPPAHIQDSRGQAGLLRGTEAMMVALLGPGRIRRPSGRWRWSTGVDRSPRRPAASSNWPWIEAPGRTPTTVTHPPAGSGPGWPVLQKIRFDGHHETEGHGVEAHDEHGQAKL